MTPSTVLSAILGELSNAAALVQETELVSMADAVLAADRVFVAGAGRSGFVARGFANRLVHLGLPVAFVGEPTTPPIQAGALLVAVSASGRTAGLLSSVEKAHQLGATVGTITTDSTGPIGLIADVQIVLPGTSRLGNRDQGGGEAVVSVQPVGTLFEQLAWLTCDALVVLIRDRTRQTNQRLIERHANLE